MTQPASTRAELSEVLVLRNFRQGPEQLQPIYIVELATDRPGERWYVLARLEPLRDSKRRVVLGDGPTREAAIVAAYEQLAALPPPASLPGST